MATVLGGLTLAPATTALAALGDSPATLAKPLSSKTLLFPTTVLGINATDDGTGYLSVQNRLAMYGRVGSGHVYYPTMPSVWNPHREGASPNHAVHVCFKGDPKALASGYYDADIRSWLASVPSGWRVYLTYWHEPNDELRNGTLSATDYRAAWTHLSQVKRGGPRPAGNVRLAPCFMGYQVDSPDAANWQDSWVPLPSEVDILVWDIYGNPGVGTTGVGYDSSYPDPKFRLDPCLKVTRRLGFAKWGVTEFNTPKRNWDFDESKRVEYLEGFRAYATATDRADGLGPARVLLLWECATGVNWDQQFKTAATKDWWTRVINA